jgi:hypothetical protein
VSCELIERELMFNRFRKLIHELTRGAVARNTFQSWEVQILVDIESCSLERRKRPEVLRQYERAVEQQLENGPGPPLLLSEFLQRKTTRRPATS